MSPVQQTLEAFERLNSRYACFHATFCILFVLELLTLLVGMPFFAKTVGIALVTASTFLTLFLYFVLRFYLQARKPEQLTLIRDQFLHAVLPSSTPIWSSQTLYPIYQLIQKLNTTKSTRSTSLAPLIHKFTVWSRFENVYWMQETLHLRALRTLLDWVKRFPTDIELHKTVAGAYIAFYQIYQPPKEPFSFVWRHYETINFKALFEKAARSALEELHVVLTYSPQDPWALGQMARVYHDLGARNEEKQTYETLLHLKPEDSDLRYALGKLYFELGLMAQGLHLYHELQAQNDPKASQLIEHYGAHHHALES